MLPESLSATPPEGSTAHRIPRPATLALAVLLILLGTVAPAHAHRVNVFAWVEGDTVHVESKFAGGNPVHQGTITVTDPEGTVVETGQTDDQGEFVFTAPKATDLTITVAAGMGHQGQWTVRENEFPAANAAETSDDAAAPTAAPVPAEPVSPEAAAPAPPPEGVSLQEVERVVDQALDRKLTPIRRMLAEEREAGPGVTEIVGGIGYIFGLMGVAAWFQSRRNREK
jgi:nickel transport protein